MNAYDPNTDPPTYTNHTTVWLPRWLTALLVTLLLLSAVGAIGGGWYIAHRIDQDNAAGEVND